MLPPDVKADLVRIDDRVFQVPAEGDGLQATLVDDGETVLFDAGMSDRWAERLAPHIDHCILTHAHARHSRAAHRFHEVWAPHEEARAMRSAMDYTAAHGVAQRDRALVERHLADLGWRAVEPKRGYRAGGLIQLATTRWEIHAAPGHSPGMCVFLEPTRHVLVASCLDGAEDALYGYPSADPDALVETFERLAGFDVAFLLGSRAAPRRRGIRPLFREKAAEIRQRDVEVLARLAEPRTLDDLVDHAPFAPGTAPIERYVRRVMVEKHLRRLIEKGLAMARQDGRFQRVD